MEYLAWPIAVIILAALFLLVVKKIFQVYLQELVM